MDTMLEILENLKSLKRNHEEMPGLYNFDYKDCLDTQIREREKVYGLVKAE
jgi:hypothetical protein